MPSGQVTIVMKAADAELVRAWQRAKEGPQGMAEELAKTEGKTKGLDRSSNSLTRSMTTGFASTARQLLGVASAGGVAASAIALIRREYDELIQRQERAAGFQVDVASAQRLALRSLPSDLSATQLKDAADQIQGETGGDVSAIYRALTGALSGKGNLSSAEAIEQVRAVMRIDPSLESNDLAALSGGSLDLRKAFAGTTAKQATGALLAGVLTSRVEDTGQYARNAVPAIMGMAAYGGKFRESSAIYSAITQESADREGERSRTAALQFAKQVNQATSSVKELEGKGFTERLDYLVSGNEQAEQVRRGLVGTFDQKVLEAGYDEKGKLTGEAAQYPALIGLLTPESHTRELYKAALKETPELSEADKVYDRNLSQQEEMGILRTKRTEEISRAALQRRLGDESEALMGVTKKGLEEYLTQLGRFGVPTLAPASWTRSSEISTLERTAELTGADPRRIAANVLEQRATNVERSGRPLTDDERGKLTELREYQAALMREALKNYRRSGDIEQATKTEGMLQRLEKILERIERNTANDKVSIKNPNEGARTANRGRARPAPIKGAGSP